jgi:hypothetical protein
MAAVSRYTVPKLAGRGRPFRALYGCTPYLSHDLAVRLVDLAVGLGGTLNTGPPLRTRLDSRPAPLTASPGRYPGQSPSPLNKYQAWLPLLQPVHSILRPSCTSRISHWMDGFYTLSVNKQSKVNAVLGQLLCLELQCAFRKVLGVDTKHNLNPGKSLIEMY